MNLATIKDSEIPDVPVRQGCDIRDITLEEMKANVPALSLVSYGLIEGDRFEFPTTREDLKIKMRQVRLNSEAREYLILGLKNGRPAWLSAANLHRWDYQTNPVHPVAAELRYCNDLTERIERCLGRTIIANGEVTYNEAVFEDGKRTDKYKPRTVSKLCFLDALDK